MKLVTRFRVVNKNGKAALVRRLMENGTPDFDYFYLLGLSVGMATLGLLLDNVAIVVGSMLIAPLMFPILGTSLGLVMLNPTVFWRSTKTLFLSLLVTLGIAVLTTVLLGGGAVYESHEIMSRTEPNLMYFLVAVIAGAAVAYVLARPEWSDTLPGVAIAVALLPPAAVTGIGLALGDILIIVGSGIILAYNLLGIAIAAFVLFLLMDLSNKQSVAITTIKREEAKAAEEKREMEEIKAEVKRSSTDNRYDQ